MEQQHHHKPVVSVVIPNYNCGPYLGKAIESIVSQTFTDWELLICDDGSTDDSLDVVEQWRKKDNRIKLYVNEVNRGTVVTYNRLFEEAMGDYVMIQDADDWSDSERIEKQLGILNRYDVQLCLCHSIFHSDPDIVPQEKIESGMVSIRGKESWLPATVMFRRSILKVVKGFSQYFTGTTSMDRYFIMDALDNYHGYFLEEYLYHVLVRPNSDHRSIDLGSASYLRKLIMPDIYVELKHQRIETGTDWVKRNETLLLKDYEAKLLGNRVYLSEKIRVFACVQIDHDRIPNALKLLKRAIWIAPFKLNNYRSLLYLIRRSLKISSSK